MGYPMTYPRVVGRNRLTGGYSDGNPITTPLGLIMGDLRRLEADQTDEYHLAEYAAVAGITPAQAHLVLEAFFTDQGRAAWARPDEWLACARTTATAVVSEDLSVSETRRH